METDRHSPATLVKDAQPIDVMRSDWKCTIDEDMHVRLGFNYPQGMRREAAERIVEERQ